MKSLSIEKQLECKESCKEGICKECGQTEVYRFIKSSTKCKNCGTIGKIVRLTEESMETYRKKNYRYEPSILRSSNTLTMHSLPRNIARAFNTPLSSVRYI